ncbi:DNA polymerase IV [Corynebacterium sp.]|uniref:DNA polymerase IV n=1 Tax=Corynebacterium sp. TaxID=1720 RepID=UPI0026DBCDBF|nr:DNA polymerase IV [Corynebacterium sp.]MDO5075910.1 DNA polymerase IV [Corynebacterium sp.]
MQRWVLHIDMDAFFASVEQLTRPTLRGRPVLVGGFSGRGVVAGASYEARAFGAKSAMPMQRARMMVGFRAVVVLPRFAVYSAASKRVFDLVRDRATNMEQLGIDEAFLEPPALIGASPDEVKVWANELRAEIREVTGLPSSIGAGSGKQYAKIGSGMAKPDGVCVIPTAEQERILGPLPVRKLWGIGPVAEAKLQRIGVRTIREFAALPSKDVELLLGSIGRSLWELARGRDDRPLAPRAEAKQVSSEHTYPADLTTRIAVERAIDRAADGALRRLAHDGRGARTVTVKLRMADFHTESRSTSLPYASDDAAVLRNAAKTLLRSPDEVGPIRLVGVSFSNLEPVYQDLLFPDLAPVLNVDNDWEVGVRSEASPVVDVEVEEPSTWFATQDVYHPDFGHGWVQGAGHGVVSVRFETRTTKTGTTRSFAIDDPRLQPADPLDSLEWADWLAENIE